MEKIKHIYFDYKTKKFKATNVSYFDKDKQLLINKNNNLRFKINFPKDIERVYEVITMYNSEKVLIERYYKPNITNISNWLYVRPISKMYCRL